MKNIKNKIAITIAFLGALITGFFMGVGYRDLALPYSVDYSIAAPYVADTSINVRQDTPPEITSDLINQHRMAGIDCKVIHLPQGITQNGTTRNENPSPERRLDPTQHSYVEEGGNQDADGSDL